MKLLSSLKKIFHSKMATGVFTIVFLGAFFIWYTYSDVEFVAANYESYSFAYYDMFLSWMMVLLMPLLISGIVYKSLHFGKKNTNKQSGILGVISGVVSAFITGCACCGVSLLSFLGLSSVISFLEIFPFHGVEIKSVAIILLAYSVYDTLTKLDVCSIKK